ncbi:MAG: glycosyltransferase family 2 protein [Lachnospiraceae bacterium]|nr:glycosyltransferase family 2 protein [Lachnospiraceae bacterium]
MEDKILYIVIPAYNEEKNIRRTVSEWYPIVARHSGNGQSRMLVIDDGSKDSTYEILKELAQDYRLLQPVTKKNGGHGDTLLMGYDMAIKAGADYVFQTDSDGQTDPMEFEPFWESLKDHDVVIGKRPVRGDGFIRKVIEKVVCVLLFCVFGVRVSDANAPYRLMKAEVLKKYLPRLPEHFNIPNIMLTTYFVKYKEKVKFINISFKPRQGGKNSINMKKIFAIGIKAVGDFIQLKKEMLE